MKMWLAMVPLCLLSCGGQVEAKGRRYELKGRVIADKRNGYNDKRYMVWLVDHARRRVLWRRRVNYYRRTWSTDGQAVAVESSGPDDWHVLVWREGFRLRDFRRFTGIDYTMGCAWSPDNRRRLVRWGGSGDTDLDVGTLFCLKLGRWPRYKYFRVTNWGVRRFGWRSRKTAIFWPIDVNPIPFKQLKPRLWRAP